MKPLFDAPLAIVDLETTGAHPVWDRVTEIAVVEVQDGEVVSEWSTLVNPGTSIPPAIQALTGITNDMVADAPAFEDLAPGLYERLEGRVFVAHNARFDYGFLRHEFERTGLRFQARTLCTVKLSRRLYPGYARHNLDSLIDRHQLRCNARHRALGDAQAVWQFLRIAAEERGADELQNVARQLAQLPALPAHIDRAIVDGIPEAPGVYLFYGENGTPLYVGKSVAMRSRVLQHFSGDVHSSREAQIAREIRSIEWRRSCGELGGLLREAMLVKELLPVFNRQLRRASELCGFVFDEKKLKLIQKDDINSETVPFLCGVFRSKRAAMDALRELANEHRLCLRALGFEKAGRGACFRHQIQRCAGVCAGRESVHAHHARAAAALAGLKTAAWPWRGPIAIVEEDREREAVELHVVDNWCLLGTARSETEVAEILAGQKRTRFDLDHYKILTRHLRAGRAKIVDLAGSPGTAVH
ncbi:MAG TPA: exonuclease domain-containing protein [Burkholderiales bacterium]|nr:exonuclease domain-containing protein [Burkholderiales bacterium]